MPTMGVGGKTFFLLIALASGIIFIQSTVEKIKEDTVLKRVNDY
jgi:hypothetical protein